MSLFNLIDNAQKVEQKPKTSLFDLFDSNKPIIGNDAQQVQKAISQKLAEAATPQQAPVLPVVTNNVKTLDEFQQAAVDDLIEQKGGVLVGGAGSGKTTTNNFLIERLQHLVPTIDLNATRIESQQAPRPEYNLAIQFVSFTGKAVQQIKNNIPAQYGPLCRTMHSAVGMVPVTYEGEGADGGDIIRFEPTFTKFNKLPIKIAIIDEAGTVPVDLFNMYVAALPDDCRILIMGDLNQLPPVAGRSVLGYAMLKWPTHELKKIHRQALDNPIIANAHRVRQGQLPVPAKPNFFMQELSDSGSAAVHQILNAIKHLHQNGLFDPQQDAFIVAQNIGDMGQEALNAKLVQYFNGPKNCEQTGMPIVQRLPITNAPNASSWAVGDRVMVLSNDPQLGLTNGMLGTMTGIDQNPQFRDLAIGKDLENFEIDLSDLTANNKSFKEHLEREEDKTKPDEERQRQASHIATVTFETPNGNIVRKFQSASDWKRIAHAYAFTCHKSQGSEFRNVVILTHSASKNLLSREWLYTAITRAKERVFLLHNRRGIMKAIQTQQIKGLTLQEKIASFNSAAKVLKDEQLPNLFEPERIPYVPFKGKE